MTPLEYTPLRHVAGDRWRRPDDGIGAAAALQAAWRAWLERAHTAQRPPDGAWRTWLFLGGRGAGKTRAGAEWLQRQARPSARLALLGAGVHEVREIMVEGESGLKAIAPADLRPLWEASRRRLVWPTGAEALAFTAEDADGLRGPQFHAAWADEFCAWRQPEEALAMLRLGLRLGRRPRLAVTTTPRPSRALRRLRAEPDLRETHAPTSANAGHLADGFVDHLERLYGGTRRAAQELGGEVVEDGGALWRPRDLAGCRGAAPAGRLERVVVAVDPPAGARAAGSERGSACGIVVAGRRGDHAWVLADRSVSGLSPEGWASAVREAVKAHDADEVVAEANQGGDMVESVLRAARVGAPVRLVRAREGKRARAEPVAALYEQGRVTHCGALEALEAQLLEMGGAEEADRGDRAGEDRADALVWAVTALMLGPRREGPRVTRV